MLIRGRNAQLTSRPLAQSIQHLVKSERLRVAPLAVILVSSFLTANLAVVENVPFTLDKVAQSQKVARLLLGHFRLGALAVFGVDSGISDFRRVGADFDVCSTLFLAVARVDVVVVVVAIHFATFDGGRVYRGGRDIQV